MEKENVCRCCAKSYMEGQRKIAKALWEQYDKENSAIIELSC
jgi:hypothetical protein